MTGLLRFARNDEEGGNDKERSCVNFVSLIKLIKPLKQSSEAGKERNARAKHNNRFSK